MSIDIEEIQIIDLDKRNSEKDEKRKKLLIRKSQTLSSEKDEAGTSDSTLGNKAERTNDVSSSEGSCSLPEVTERRLQYKRCLRSAREKFGSPHSFDSVTSNPEHQSQSSPLRQTDVLSNIEHSTFRKPRLTRSSRKLQDSIDEADCELQVQNLGSFRSGSNSPEFGHRDWTTRASGLSSSFQKHDSQHSLRLSNLPALREQNQDGLSNNSSEGGTSTPPRLHKFLEKSHSSDKILHARNSRHRLFQKAQTRINIPELAEEYNVSRRESLLSNVVLGKERRRESSLSDLCNELVSVNTHI